VKRSLILSFVAFAVLAYGQKTKIVYPYINNVLFPKGTIKVDSFHCRTSEIDNISVSLINKGFVNIQLDSVICNDTCAHVFYSNVFISPFCFVVYDEKGELIKKSSYKKNAYHKFNNLTNNLIQDMENKGFPFAQITLDSLYIQQHKFIACYSLHPKWLIQYDSLDIIGKINISRKFLQSYTGLSPEKIYNEKKIKQLDNRLNELLFIKLQKPSDIFFINDKAKARLYVSKNSANQFDGIVGMQTSDKQKVQLTGDVSLVLKNTLKHADDISVHWKKLTGTSQSMDLLLSYPYLFSYPLGVNGTFSLLKQDSLYVNTNFKAGIFFYTSGFNGAMIYYEQRQSNVLATNQSSVNLTVQNFSIHSMGLSYHFASLDNIILPQKGFDMTYSISYGNKTVQKNSSIPDTVTNVNKHEQLKAEIMNVAYIPVKYPFFVKVRLIGAYMDNIQFMSEEFRLGGNKTIRGFDEESIYSSPYILGSIEPRFIVDRNTQCYVFFDKAWYKSLQVNHDSPWGIGVGTDFYTKAGVFYISYALGSQNNQSLMFKNAKIHFGYRNRF